MLESKESSFAFRTQRRKIFLGRLFLSFSLFHFIIFISFLFFSCFHDAGGMDLEGGGEGKGRKERARGWKQNGGSQQLQAAPADNRPRRHARFHSQTLPDCRSGKRPQIEQPKFSHLLSRNHSLLFLLTTIRAKRKKDGGGKGEKMRLKLG